MDVVACWCYLYWVQFVYLNVRSMQQMLDYEGDDFQDVFGIAFEVTELHFYACRLWNLIKLH